MDTNHSLYAALLNATVASTWSDISGDIPLADNI